MNVLKIKENAIAFLNSLEKSDQEKLASYFRKFLPVWEDLKEECDFKYCVCLSGRYCNNCPHHPLRSINPECKIIYDKCLVMIADKEYISFISYLYDVGLPFPIAQEMENQLKKNN